MEGRENRAQNPGEAEDNHSVSCEEENISKLARREALKGRSGEPTLLIPLKKRSNLFIIGHSFPLDGVSDRMLEEDGW